MSKPYRWKVTDASDLCGEAIGVEGPGGLDPDIKDNAVQFFVYDDDDVYYFRGWLYGEYEGDEPLIDYGVGCWGACHIRLAGDPNYLY